LIRVVLCGVAASAILTNAKVRAQDMPAEYQQVLTALGKQGDYKANVLKVNIPRNDVAVTVAGVKTPTPFGFGGWIAMTKGQGMDVMMGDLVLTQDEVTPVLKALLNNGLDVVAIHHHMTATQPTIYFLHYWGTGPAEKLATGFKAALAETGGRN